MVDVPDVQYAKSGGASIAYQVVGTGPPDLVITPGFTSHLDLQWTMPSFVDFMEQLASFARVIIFDKLGTGLSDPTAGVVRFDRRIDDIEAVMDGAGSDRAALMGVSEGGPLSALFAATHPERVSAIVLYGTFARGGQLHNEMWAKFDDAVRHWGEGRTAAIFSAAQAGSSVRRRLAGIYERASASPAMAQALLDSIREADVTDVLSVISAPCLVLHRSGDSFADPAWAEDLAKAIPGARLELVYGDEHLPWFGDHRSLVDAISRFLTGHEARPESSRVLATVLFTDIVGSTEHAVRLGDEDWSRLLSEHDGLVRESLSIYRGTEIKTTGDGFLVMFDSPARAVECALELIDRLAHLDLQIRAGVHTGECEFSGGDLRGMAVHIGARLAAVAEAGEVLVSSTVRDLVVGSGLTFTPRGGRRLKGVPGTWNVFAVVPPEEAAELQPHQLERRLRPGDRLSLLLARRAPGALRALAGMGVGRA